MAQVRYSPKAAAEAVGIGASTVRVWAREFGEFMSPGANPGDGSARLFVDADLAVLQVVKELRGREALTYDQCLARLREMPRADLQKPFVTPVAPSSGVTAASSVVASDSPATGLDSPQAAQLPAVRGDPVTLFDSRLTTILEAQAALATDVAALRRERSGVILVAAGVGAGVIVGLLLALLIVALLR